jgi:outer membrane protein OmpA-like peptidoglycan-associated protein
MLSRVVIFLVFLFGTTSSFAQQSSNSKSKTKTYEKGASKVRGVELWNCSNINNKFTNSLPAFYQNGIVFMSAPNEGQLDVRTNEPRYELYYAESDRNFVPMKPVSYSLEANSTYHEGGVTYNKNGNLMFFSSNNQKNGMSIADRRGDVNMKIYSAKRGVLDWEEVMPLPFNSDKFTCFHPSLSPDGRFLYFSSNMPGGQGGYDLYVVEKKGNTWTKPTNLGTKINTKGDEAFPFIHESGVLFFSAKGGIHPNVAASATDWDIYRIDMTKTGAAVKNLGEPYNSSSDDLALILNPDGDIGYFASNRAEQNFGSDDIYLFKSENRLTGESFDINSLITVKDEGDQSRVESAEIRIFEKTVNGFFNGQEFYNVEMPQNGKDIGLKLVRKEASKMGKPNLYSTANGEAKYDMKNDREYLILVNKEGYETKELPYTTFDKAAGLVFIDVLLKKMSKPKLIGTVLSNKNTRIPNAVVKIVNLSTKKIQELTANSNGEFEFPAEANTEYEISAEAKGYKLANSEKINIGTASRTNEVKVTLTANEPEVVAKPISTGTVIVLEKIYYDFDKAIIRQGAAQELEALVSLMQQYPSMEVELTSHTDSRGKTEYNQKLSAARADAARSYLMARGIVGERITARGAGESQLRNRCVDGANCSEEEHQYNRRTEVRITKINETAVKVQYGDKGPEVINGKN